MSSQVADRTSPQGEVAETHICFLGSPAFDVWYWSDGELHYAQAKGLDVIAATSDRDDLPQKLGSMIEDLMFFLVEEVEDPSEGELETLKFIVDRLGPPLAKYHRQQRHAARWRRLRALFGSNIEWRMGPPSTPHGSVPALSG